MPDLEGANTSPEIHFPDYSEWLTPDRLTIEEAVWERDQDLLFQPRADAIIRVCRQHGLRSVVEFGCGTGWLAIRIPSDLDYLGLDANTGCIERAQQRCPTRTFLQGDARTVTASGWDLSCSFSLLKHFGLHEWGAVATRLIGTAPRSLFTIQLAAADHDDGTEFHHTWISLETLDRAVTTVGQKIHALYFFSRIAPGRYEVLVETEPITNGLP